MRVTLVKIGPMGIELTLTGTGDDETLALARLYDARHVHLVCKQIARHGRAEKATVILALKQSSLRFRALRCETSVVIPETVVPAKRRRG